MGRRWGWTRNQRGAMVRDDRATSSSEASSSSLAGAEPQPLGGWPAVAFVQEPVAGDEYGPSNPAPVRKDGSGLWQEYGVSSFFVKTTGGPRDAHKGGPSAVSWLYVGAVPLTPLLSSMPFYYEDDPGTVCYGVDASDYHAVLSVLEREGLAFQCRQLTDLEIRNRRELLKRIVIQDPNSKNARNVILDFEAPPTPMFGSEHPSLCRHGGAKYDSIMSRYRMRL